MKKVILFLVVYIITGLFSKTFETIAPERKDRTYIKHHSWYCVVLIKRFEDVRLRAYWDVNSFAIGFGEHDKRWIRRNTHITLNKAENLLDNRLGVLSDSLSKNLRIRTQNQFDAIISIIYNIGWSGFKKSRTFKALQKDQTYELKTTFYDHVYCKGKKNSNLINRRTKELELFFKNN
jgi:lysozyme